MNRIEISCFDKRLDLLIDFTKTYNVELNGPPKIFLILPRKQVLDFPHKLLQFYKAPLSNLSSSSPQVH